MKKEKKDILDRWYSNHCALLPGTSENSDIKISDEQVSELIEQTSLPKKKIMQYIRLRDKDPIIEIDISSVDMKMTNEQKDILDAWYYTKNCLKGYSIKNAQASELAEQTGLPKDTIKEYMKSRKEGPFYDNHGPECSFTSQTLKELLRHQNEEHNVDKPNVGEIPQEESDATDPKIPRITNDPGDDSVDDDDDINLTQNQEEESPEVAGEVGQIMSPQKMKLY